MKLRTELDPTLFGNYCDENKDYEKVPEILVKWNNGDWGICRFYYDPDGDDSVKLMEQHCCGAIIDISEMEGYIVLD